MLSEWRAAHGGPPPVEAQRSSRSLWIVIVAALLALAPRAIVSLAQHRVGPAEAAAAVHEIMWGD